MKTNNGCQQNLTSVTHKLTLLPGQKVRVEAQDPTQERGQVQGQGPAPEEKAAATAAAATQQEGRRGSGEE